MTEDFLEDYRVDVVVDDADGSVVGVVVVVDVVSWLLMLFPVNFLYCFMLGYLDLRDAITKDLRELYFLISHFLPMFLLL